MRDRHLFSADRASFEYRGVLEITPGRAGLLLPSNHARNVRGVMSVALAAAYGVLWYPILTAGLAAGALVSLAGSIVLVATAALWLVGLILVLLWWDRQSVPLLTYGSEQGTDLVLPRARSFGSFQEVRARAPGGNEFVLVVDGKAPPFWEAVGLLEGKGRDLRMTRAREKDGRRAGNPFRVFLARAASKG